jgi:hypothetical protein
MMNITGSALAACWRGKKDNINVQIKEENKP